MADPSPTTKQGDLTMAGNGTGKRPPAPRYCGFCGHEILGSAPSERFGEVFCSEDHAEAFVKGVRGARVAAAATAADVPAAASPQSEASMASPATPSDWKMKLKMAACCAVPMLALVVLAGGGGALLGTAGAALPFLLMLACPIGMFFMMRGMKKDGQDDKRPPRDGAQ